MYVDDSQTKLLEQTIEGHSENLKVYRADEYYNKRKGEIVTGQVLMAVSAALSTANAGRSTSYTRGSYSGYRQNRGHYYHGYVTYTSTTTTYDPTAAEIEREIAFANVRDYINGTNSELDFLKDTLFYPSDIDPNGEYYGIIVSDFGETNSSLIVFEVEFETSHFRFEFTKDQVQYSN